MTIGEIVDQFDITRAAIKKHLNILQEGALISVHVRGRERLNRLEPEGLKTTADWFNYFDRFWDQRLGNLKQAIENENRSISRRKK